MVAVASEHQSDRHRRPEFPPEWRAASDAIAGTKGRQRSSPNNVEPLRYNSSSTVLPHAGPI